MKYETLYTAVIANLDQLLQREDISVDESFALAEAMNLIELAAEAIAMHNVKLAPACDALLVVSPEHHRTFRNAGWSRQRLLEELYRLCEIPGEKLVSGVLGIAQSGQRVDQVAERRELNEQDALHPASKKAP